MHRGHLHRGHDDVPGGRRLVVVRPARVQRVLVFFAAWGQMLNYIITVAISAFFVPHYLGVFWAPLGESPADIVGGIIVVAVLAALNIIGVRSRPGSTSSSR